MLNSLPQLNAVLNAASAGLLAFGYFQIRRRNVRRHRLAMIGAFASSVLFLVGYLTNHAVHGIIRYAGTGWRRPVYFSILGTHTILAMVIVPMVMRTLYLASRARFDEHRGLARWTLPLWFYVSVTGVIIYEMLY